MKCRLNQKSKQSLKPFCSADFSHQGGGGETAYKYKLGAGRLIYIYPGR